MSALVPVSLSANYETRGPFTVWRRMTFTPAVRGLIDTMLLCPQRNCLPCILVNFSLDLGMIQLQALTWNFLDLREFPSLWSFSTFPFDLGIFSFLGDSP